MANVNQVKYLNAEQISRILYVNNQYEKMFLEQMKFTFIC